MLSPRRSTNWSGSPLGLRLDVVRTGRGYGPNMVRVDVGDLVATASGSSQFPILSRATVPDDTILVAQITTALPGSRWCGLDLKPNSILLYDSGSEHTGISPAGLRYSIASIGVKSLEESAERHGVVFRRPERGRVVDVGDAPEAASLAHVLGSLNDPLRDSNRSPWPGGIHADIHHVAAL